ncbi:MAG: asparagine synthetase B [Candidatus Diapherotrites archaeon]
MSSITGIISKKREDVPPYLIDSLFQLRHRGNDYFSITINNETFTSNRLREIRDNFAKGSIGLATGKNFIAEEEREEGVPLYFDGRIYHPKFKELIEGNKRVEFKAKKILSSVQGNYVIALKEKNCLHAFRDFIGAKPLWYGENDSFTAFCSEPGPLKKLDISFPQPLLPGHVLSATAKGIKIQKIYDLSDFRKAIPKKTSLQKLKKAFLNAVEIETQGLKKTSVLFSAGLDSTLTAKIVGERIPDTKLITVGVQDSEDIAFSEEIARELGLPLKKRIVREEEIIGCALKTLKALSFFDLMQLQIGMPEFIAGEELKKENLRTAFAGQGSDEIFAGYSNYKTILKEKGFKAVEEEIWISLKELWQRNLFRDEIIFSHHSIELCLPLLEKNFLRQAMVLPTKQKIYSSKDDLRKRALRKIALQLGVPKKVCERKKKAMQYGSGLAPKISRLFSGK